MGRSTRRRKASRERTVSSGDKRGIAWHKPFRDDSQRTSRRIPIRLFESVRSAAERPRCRQTWFSQLCDQCQFTNRQGRYVVNPVFDGVGSLFHATEFAGIKRSRVVWPEQESRPLIGAAART